MIYLAVLPRANLIHLMHPTNAFAQARLKSKDKILLFRHKTTADV